MSGIMGGNKEGNKPAMYMQYKTKSNQTKT